MKPLSLVVITLMTLSSLLIACGEETEIDSASSLTAAPELDRMSSGKEDRVRKIGVFLTSHGDIDEFEEIEPYIRSAFLKNVGVPLNRTLRELLQDPAYWLSRDLIEGQYKLIGPTRYRANAQLQMDAIQEELDNRGIPAKVYIGYNFMPPFIEDTAAVMRAEGVTDVVMFNKGAQFSLATLGESIEEFEYYLHDKPGWDAQVIAVKQYSDDERFIEIFVDTLKQDIETYFSDIPAADTCILIASHGLPMRLIGMGDPAVDQMRETFKELQRRLPDYPLYHGFLNDDFFPGAEWVGPSAPDVAHEMRSVSCPATLMDARLSFTTHHRATLYDLEVDVRSILEEPDFQGDGTPHPLWKAPRVVFADQWDDHPDFARLMVELTEEALRGEGDLLKIQ